MTEDHADERRPGQRETAPDELAPADYFDSVVEAYKKDVDRTLLRENLKLTVEERIRRPRACTGP